MDSSKKVIFISVSTALYLVALFLPSYSDSKNYYGWECIPNGIFTLEKLDSNPFMFISWISNLPYYIGLIVFMRAKKRKGFVTARGFLVISFFMSLGVLTRFRFTEIGCAFWIAAQLVAAIGAIILYKQFKTGNANPDLSFKQ